MRRFLFSILVVAAPASAWAATAQLTSIEAVEPATLRPQVQKVVEALMPKLARCVPSDATGPALISAMVVDTRFDGQGGQTSQLIGNAADKRCVSLAFSRAKLPDGLTRIRVDFSFSASAQELADTRAKRAAEVKGFCATFTEIAKQAAAGTPMNDTDLLRDAAVAAGFGGDAITFSTEEWLHSMLSVNPADVPALYRGGVSEIGGDPACPAIEKYAADFAAGKPLRVKIKPPPTQNQKAPQNLFGKKKPSGG